MQRNVCRILDGAVGLNSYDHVVSVVSVGPDFFDHLGFVGQDFSVVYGQGWEEVAINFSEQSRYQVHHKKSVYLK